MENSWVRSELGLFRKVVSTEDLGFCQLCALAATFGLSRQLFFLVFTLNESLIFNLNFFSILKRKTN